MVAVEEPTHWRKCDRMRTNAENASQFLYMKCAHCRTKKPSSMLNHERILMQVVHFILPKCIPVCAFVGNSRVSKLAKCVAVDVRNVLSYAYFFFSPPLSLLHGILELLRKGRKVIFLHYVTFYQSIFAFSSKPKNFNSWMSLPLYVTNKPNGSKKREPKRTFSWENQCYFNFNFVSRLSLITANFSMFVLAKILFRFVKLWLTFAQSWCKFICIVWHRASNDLNFNALTKTIRRKDDTIDDSPIFIYFVVLFPRFAVCAKPFYMPSFMNMN